MAAGQLPRRLPQPERLGAGLFGAGSTTSTPGDGVWQTTCSTLIRLTCLSGCAFLRRKGIVDPPAVMHTLGLLRGDLPAGRWPPAAASSPIHPDSITGSLQRRSGRPAQSRTRPAYRSVPSAATPTTPHLDATTACGRRTFKRHNAWPTGPDHVGAQLAEIGNSHKSPAGAGSSASPTLAASRSAAPVGVAGRSGGNPVRCEQPISNQQAPWPCDGRRWEFAGCGRAGSGAGAERSAAGRQRPAGDRGVA